MTYVLAESFAAASRWARSVGVSLGEWAYLEAGSLSELHGAQPNSRLVVVGGWPKWSLINRDLQMLIDIRELPIEEVPDPSRVDPIKKEGA